MPERAIVSNPLTHLDLAQQLDRLDGQGYKGYRDIERRWYEFDQFDLRIDHAQADPFAAPSACRVWVPPEVLALPSHATATPIRQIAVRDFINRQFAIATHRTRDQGDRPPSPDRPQRGGDRGYRGPGGNRGPGDRGPGGNRGPRGPQPQPEPEQSPDISGSGKSGAIEVTRPSQIVLARSAVVLIPEEDGTYGVEVRFAVGLPAFGRRIAGRQARTLLCEKIPALVLRSLRYSALDANALRHHLDTVEDSHWLREQLRDRGLVSFIPNGAILPRRSGADDRPATGSVVPFQSPPSLEVSFERPHGGPISGMGIPQGITLLVGGGYHGKSTLLQAIERGIYDHCPGDGREGVVTDPSAVKIRAEDGRAIAGTDISTFIQNLPQGLPTDTFVTANASGSTSQAAAIAEALEAGTTLLLADEDSCATNLMGRDRRMQALVPSGKEPIITLLDTIRPLREQFGVSWVLAMGANGDYFDVADTVIALDAYRPQDVTAAAKAIAQDLPSGRVADGNPNLTPLRDRYPDPASLDPSRGQRAVKWTVRDTRQLVFGTDEIDLAAISQLVEPAQLKAIAQALVQLKDWLGRDRVPIPTLLDQMDQHLSAQGLDGLSGDTPRGDLASFRRYELAATLNRLRSLRLR